MLPLYKRNLPAPVVVWLVAEESIQRLAWRREPRAVVNHLGVVECQLLFVVQCVAVERESF